MKKQKIIRILNIIEPILCLLFEIGSVCCTIFALDNADWISLGGQLREWYWYETLIIDLTVIFFIVIIIFELFMFFNIKKRYKLYTIIYYIIDLIIYYLVWNYSLIGSLISIFLFNLVKCIYRIINLNKIF